MNKEILGVSAYWFIPSSDYVLLVRGWIECTQLHGYMLQGRRVSVGSNLTAYITNVKYLKPNVTGQFEALIAHSVPPQ